MMQRRWLPRGSVAAEKTTKVAIMLAKHAIETLFSNQPDAIRLLQIEAA